MTRRSSTGTLALGVAVCAGVLACAVASGTRSVPTASLWRSVLGAGDPVTDAVVLGVRLPRVVAAALVGAALSVAGALMQGATRNPLAGPSLAGLNTGATLAVLCGVLWLPGVSATAAMGVAFVGAAAAAAVALTLGAFGGLGGPSRLVLAGATLNLTLGAAIVGLVVHHQLHMDLLYWTTGGLIGVTWSQVRALAPATVLGLGLAVLLAPSVTALSLGDDAAGSLGLRAARTRALALGCVVLLAGAAVAVAGPIGFVGLIVPHLVRGLVGGDYRRIVPAAALAGATLLVGADLGVRLLAERVDVPLGCVTAPVGGAAFVALLWRGRAVAT
ncbi:MAG: iron ABC transporter permease [Myxococcales bacterium]|nr:iron ABC transporter permease [Myxococcales bacterium]